MEGGGGKYRSGQGKVPSRKRGGEIIRPGPSKEREKKTNRDPKSKPS